MTHFSTDDVRWTFVAKYELLRKYSSFTITTSGGYQTARGKAESILTETVEDAGRDFGEREKWFLEVESVEEISE